MMDGYIPRREQFGHRRPGTGRKTTPMRPGPLGALHANIPDGRFGGFASAQKSARREQMMRRPGTGRHTTPRRFNIQDSAAKNRHGPLVSRMRSAMQSPGYQVIRPSYAAEQAQAAHHHPYNQQVAYGAPSRREVGRQQRKAGTGHVTARRTFNFTISSTSRRQAAMAMEQQQMERQQAERQQYMEQQTHYSSAPDFSDEGADLTIRAPPTAAAQFIDGTHMRRDHSVRPAVVQNELVVRAPPAMLEEMLSTAFSSSDGSVSVRGGPRALDASMDTTDTGATSDAESVEYSDHGPVDMPETEESMAGDDAMDDSLISSADSEAHETTVDPDELEEQLRQQEKEEREWAKPPEQDIAELDAQDVADAEAQEADVSSDDDDDDGGGGDDDAGMYPPEEEQESELQLAVESVATPPDEPTSPPRGVRRSRRRKFSPLAFWKNERVAYKRRLSAACLDVTKVVKVADTVTPYKRRKKVKQPLAIMDRA
jgi:hypothetical protein